MDQRNYNNKKAAPPAMGWDSKHPYRGSAGGMKDSPYLASDDILDLRIPGQDPGTVITSIVDIFQATNLTFEGGRKKDKGWLLWVKNKDNKMLVLNATNRKILAKAYGSSDVTWWIGKRVKLWVDPNVKLAGELVNGIRITPIDPPSTPPKGWKLPDGWKPGDDPNPTANTAAPEPDPTDPNEPLLPPDEGEGV